MTLNIQNQYIIDRLERRWRWYPPWLPFGMARRRREGESWTTL